jgi:hypothetical protein
MEEAAKLSKDARETQRLAARSAAPRSGTKRRAVLRAIVEAGDSGMTDDEISALLHMSPNTARPRRLELLEGCWIEETDVRRDSFYGNPSIVWKATPQGVLLIEGGGRASS